MTSQLSEENVLSQSLANKNNTQTCTLAKTARIDPMYKRGKHVMRGEDLWRRLFFEHAVEGFFRSTISGRFTEVNPALVHMLGYESAEEVLALTLPEHLYSNPTQYRDLSLHFAAGGTVEGRELHWKRKDGSSLVVILYGQAVHGLHNAVIAYEGMVRNLMEQKQAQEAQQTDAGLARIGWELIPLLNTPTLLPRLCQLAVEETGCAASHTFLWKPQEAVYLPIAGWGDAQEQWEVIRKLKISGASLTNLVSNLRAERVALVTAAAARDLLPVELRQFGMTSSLWIALRRDEELVGVLSLEHRGRDISFNPQQKRLAYGIGALATLALANMHLLQELTHANRLKSDFLATISHELRTPLHIILGYADCLLQGDCGPLTIEQQKMLQSMDWSARGLLELIVALFEASQLETMKPPIAYTEVNVAEFVAELQREVKYLSNRPTLSFVWRVPPRLPRLYTDPVKLLLILKSLLSNAVKFTPEGTVTVEVAPQGAGVEFRVSDTGVGIASEIMPVIFELFRQGDSSSTRLYGGAGLGLHVVRQLLDVLGGTITVESEVGRGSIFRVWLPSRSPQKS